MWPVAKFFLAPLSVRGVSGIALNLGLKPKSTLADVDAENRDCRIHPSD
jgi:hypothetical protein